MKKTSLFSKVSVFEKKIDVGRQEKKKVKYLRMQRRTQRIITRLIIFYVRKMSFGLKKSILQKVFLASKIKDIFSYITTTKT